MKKRLIICGCLGLFLSSYAGAQTLNVNYPNSLYKYTSDNALSGTARYRGLNGAMGALGGDLSASMDNPAGTAVFLRSEAGMTANFQNGTLNSDFAGDNYSYKSNAFNVSQAGAAMVFNTNYQEDWKSFAFSVNYQRNNTVDETLDIHPKNIFSTFYAGNRLDRIYMQETGNSSTTNFNFAGNYKNKVYVGLGLNFHSFSMNRFEGISEYSSAFGKSFNYNKDYAPFTRVGNGFSVGLGVIGKVTPNLRLGFAYESPKWYRDIEEQSLEYFITKETDKQGDYYIVKNDPLLRLNDLNSAQKFTGSAAFVIGKKGLISVDYTYTDFGSAKFMPEKDFGGENSYLHNDMKGSSTVKVGAETRIQNVSLRAGFRYQQSPFDKDIQIAGTSHQYRPYGDLTGYSVGVGYNFHNFYVDASYDFLKQDRNYLLYGNYYDLGGNINVADLTPNPTLDEAAKQTLSRNMKESGYETSVENITQKQGNLTFTVGFRF